MIIDAVDAQGRRYMEVQAWREAPSGMPSQACVECGGEIRYGHDRYFQRNDATDGQSEQLPATARGALLRQAKHVIADETDDVAMLMALTYDPVCGECGDSIIARDAR